MPVTTFTREISPEERRVLHATGLAHPPGFPSIGHFLFACLITCAVFAVVLIVLFAIPLKSPAIATWIFWIGCVASVLSGISYIFIKRREFLGMVRNWQSGVLLRDIQNNMVDVLRVSSSSVVIVLAREDEGSKFCYRITDSQFLVIRESDFDHLPIATASCSSETMPNADFTVVRLPQSKEILGSECHGRKLDPVATVNECPDSGLVVSGDIVNGDWNDVVLGRIQL